MEQNTQNEGLIELLRQELIFLSPRQRFWFNLYLGLVIVLLLISYQLISMMSFFMFIVISMQLVSFRTWWPIICKPTDSFFWLGVKIKISTAALFFTTLLAWINVIILKTGKESQSLAFDLTLTFPFPIIGLLMNLANGCKLLRFWYICYRYTEVSQRQQEHEDQLFERVFGNREGYSEAIEEINAAGIDSAEIEEVQRMELRNTRRLLGQLGSRAMPNIGMLRFLLNIDGDRDPEDTEENRIILFTKITSLPFNKEKHGASEACTICCVNFEEGQYIKVLPKCSHLFHEDCIESWILKAKHRLICCPICRTNIKEELEAQEQLAQNDETADSAIEDSKNTDLDESAPNIVDNNLLNMTENEAESMA